MVRTALMLLWVALWLPSASHALLTGVGHVHAWHGDHDDDAHHAAADGQCLRAAQEVDVPAPPALAATLWVSLDVAALLSALTPTLDHIGAAPPGSPPLELATTWQFCVRAARSPRAPSLAS